MLDGGLRPRGSQTSAHLIRPIAIFAVVIVVLPFRVDIVTSIVLVKLIVDGRAVVT